MTKSNPLDHRVTADDEEPAPDRQAYLQAKYDENSNAGRPPYSDTTIRDLGELHWIFGVRNWSGELEAEGHARPKLASVILRGANLREVQLVGADLTDADLSEVQLGGANLTGAVLISAYLTGADLSGVIMRECDLTEARLRLTNLSDADMTGANLSAAQLPQANLTRTNLSEAVLRGANLSQATLIEARLAKATMSPLQGSGAAFTPTDLTGADLSRARLTDAILSSAILATTNLGSANLTGATLHGADLRGTRMDVGTTLTGILLDSEVKLGDVVWNNAPLTQVDWGQAPRLGDELAIMRSKGNQDRITASRSAARAYRGLAIALRQQGMLIFASAYRLREQRLERIALRVERSYGAWLFSGLLDLVSGYGEAPGRTLRAYITIVLVFAGAFLFVTHALHTQSTQLTWYESLVLSISSFHGRGFFPSYSLGDPVAIVASFEAITGLFIELVFIATFSRRFLGS